MKKNAHGGYRKGSGRKPPAEPKRRLNIYLNQKTIEHLKQIDTSISHAIEKLVNQKTL